MPTVWASTVTITNLISQTPPRFIDTGTTISGLALTGNILVVVGSDTMIAWQLTKEGTVDGVFGDRRVGPGDSIWAELPMVNTASPKFFVKGQTGFIMLCGAIESSYDAVTGELSPRDLLPLGIDNTWYNLEDMSLRQFYLCHHESSQYPFEDNLRTTFREGWVKDPEGKHRLWIPVEWRTADSYAKWFYYVANLQLKLPGGELIAIMF